MLQHFCRVADWFGQLNNKMGGDLKKIQTVGAYFVEIWKAVGMESIGEKVNSRTLASCRRHHSTLITSRLSQLHASLSEWRTPQAHPGIVTHSQPRACRFSF